MEIFGPNSITENEFPCATTQDVITNLLWILIITQPSIDNNQSNITYLAFWRIANIELQKHRTPRKHLLSFVKETYV